MDTPFWVQPRRPAAMAGPLAVGLALTVAGCAGVTPLGPDATPGPAHLRSPIVMEAMLVRPPSAPGSCPAGYAAISAPEAAGNTGLCYRQLGVPVTFTSAAVTSFQPRTPPGGAAAGSGLLITLPAADIAVLTAVTTTAYDARGAVEISVAGRPWAIPMESAPLTGGQFTVVLPTGGQAAQLRRQLSSGG